jgi:hypothetical protein
MAFPFWPILATTVGPNGPGGKDRSDKASPHTPKAGAYRRSFRHGNEEQGRVMNPRKGEITAAVIRRQ